MYPVTEDLHEFEKAGYGAGPYNLQDIEFGHDFVCDVCGQKGLVQHFIFRSVTDQVFGVGSTCMHKADPEKWQELKTIYGSSSNITANQVERRQLWDKAQELHKTYLELVGKQVPNRELDAPFERVKGKQLKHFEMLVRVAEEKIATHKAYLERKAEVDQQKMKLIEEIRSLLRPDPLMIKRMGDRFAPLAWHIAETSGRTDRLRDCSETALRVIINELDIITRRYAA